MFLEILLYLPEQKSLKPSKRELNLYIYKDMLKTLFSIIQEPNKNTGQLITLKGKSETEPFCLHLLSVFVAVLSALEHQILLHVVQ